MKFSPPSLTVGLDVAAEADAVWDLLVQVDQWPRWGPTVRRARVHGVDVGSERGGRIGPDATGTVWTSVGPAVTFRIDAWQDTGRVRHWSWRVAGVHATGHTVRAHEGGCRVEMTAPWWAPAYAPVLWLALRRIRDLAQARPAAGDTTG
ncbi:SRPBCC family protein [Knoellia sp. S7-12]|uniref:SRPBCC family protein n=1 Tax=Knoellia sp. S7-12 TaxID=3126698 RepID=UPI003365B831